MDKAMEKLANLSNKQIISKDKAADARKQNVLLAFDFVKKMNLLKKLLASMVPENLIPLIKELENHADVSKNALGELTTKLKELCNNQFESMETINQNHIKWIESVCESSHLYLICNIFR